jgi:hypothetical protein
MITLQELLRGAVMKDLSQDIQGNLMTLLERINKVRTAYNKPMTVSSPLRTMADHLRIYEEKAKKEGKPFDKSKVPMQSRHLYGKAVDIADPKQELQKWCKDNEKLLAEIGLWMEDFSATKTWVHFQTEPPKSGKRWFMP